MPSPLRHSCFAAIALFAAASTAAAATTQVSSVAELQAAIGAAVAGDTIIVTDGVYTTSAAVTINKVGAAGAPITVKAETVGGVEFQGTHGISLSSPAAYIVVEGFVFAHQSGRVSMPNGTHHSRYTRNVFKCVGDGPYLSVAGSDHEVDRNEFRDKSTVGNMISVSGSGSQVAQRLWVHHNYFHDFTSPGVNGAETLRFGLSGLSMSNGDGLVEYNLFVRCNGENELISNKSGGNTYRYNTLIDSPGAQLTLRHGNDCVVYGNYFRNTAGLRVFGDRHLIFSNYFEGNSIGIDMGNGDGEVADGAELTAHDRPDDAVVVYNTLVNNNTQYQMGGRTGGLGALRAVVDNNIIQGGSRAVSISSSAPYTGTFANNILWNVPTIGNIPAGGYTIEDPRLAPDASGIFHIQAGSPAIGAGVGDFPGVVVDMDGQPRDSAKDKGADEVSGAPIVARILTVADVGPGLGGPPPEPTPPDGEWIEFTLPAVPRGTYDFVLRFKSHPANRAIARLFVDGVRQGNDLNQLSAATFKTQGFGVVRFAEAGDHLVRLAVVGKTNVATTPWNLTADVFTFVPDSKKPVITTPLPDLTLEATGPSGAPATYAAEATDVKDGIVPVVFTPPSGTVFPLGTTTVTATATDFHGNVATASFDVTVVDTTAPVLTLPPDVTITTCERPNIGQATATDLASTPVVTSDAPALFGLGVTLVTWTAVDPSGNVAAGVQRVTVELGDDAKCCPAGTRVFVGTSASNVILGTSGSDCIVGLGGNDVINALGGDDFISGGAGNDTIVAGVGNDLVMAGAGDDIVDGSLGNDIVRGGAGRDVIAAGPGSDDVDGGTETDVCAVPPDGADTVVGCP